MPAAAAGWPAELMNGIRAGSAQVDRVPVGELESRLHDGHPRISEARPLPGNAPGNGTQPQPSPQPLSQ
jgi:hypothetical protein